MYSVFIKAAAVKVRIMPGFLIFRLKLMMPVHYLRLSNFGSLHDVELGHVRGVDQPCARKAAVKQHCLSLRLCVFGISWNLPLCPAIPDVLLLAVVVLRVPFILVPFPPTSCVMVPAPFVVPPVIGFFLSFLLLTLSMLGACFCFFKQQAAKTLRQEAHWRSGSRSRSGHCGRTGR